jgi:hypothetical protein
MTGGSCVKPANPAADNDEGLVPSPLAIAVTMTTLAYSNPNAYSGPTEEEWRVIENASRPLERSPWLPLAFVPPLILCGISWLSGGVSALTDLGMILLTGLCIGGMISELRAFSRRFGVGGFVLYGGTLIWFCDDYIRHLAFSMTELTGYGRDVIAKDAYYVCLLVLMMVIGLRSRRLLFLNRWMSRIPELRDPQMGVWIMVFIFLFGISPFFFYTGEPFYMAIIHSILGARGGVGTAWLGGRTGNLNYNWSAYIAYFLVVGQIGAVYAIFFTVLLARGFVAKAVGWFIWTFYLLQALGTGTRGEVVAMTLPLILVLFIKHHSTGRRFNPWAYLVASILLLFTLAIVQFQITFRRAGFYDADLSKVSVTDLQDNTMFADGLLAFKMVPDHKEFFGNHYYIDGIIRPLPEKLMWFFIGPMPRALWTTKPLDDSAVWYNQLTTGEKNGYSGTTISSGLAAHWYMRYGLFGVIEGGLLFGWLLKVGERAIQQSSGRINLLLLALGWETWLFRCYRDFYFPDLYNVLIGVLFLGFVCYLANQFSAGEPSAVPALN